MVASVLLVKALGGGWQQPAPPSQANQPLANIQSPSPAAP
jgi:hypothetical protein